MPTPDTEVLAKLLNELELRCNPKYQTGLEDLFLEKEGPKLLAISRWALSTKGTLKAIRQAANEGSEEYEDWNGVIFAGIATEANQALSTFPKP